MTSALLRFSTLVMLLAALIGLPIPGWGQGTQPTAAVSMRGAGSTLAAPLWKKWIEEYAVGHRGVSVTYDAVGAVRA